MSENYDGKLPHGWQGGEAITKWWRGSFVHLYRLRKNCAQCQQELLIDVTKAALTGEAKNAGLQLQRCYDCRSAAKASRSALRPHGRTKLTAERVPETIAAAHTSAPEDKEELERLREWEAVLHRVLRLVQSKFPDATMTNLPERAEMLIKAGDDIFAKCQAAINEVQPLKAEIHALKVKLAQYELQPAMEAQAAASTTVIEAVAVLPPLKPAASFPAAPKPFNPHEELAKIIAKKNKFPWSENSS